MGLVDRFGRVLQRAANAAAKFGEALAKPSVTPSSNPAMVAPDVHVPGVQQWSSGTFGQNERLRALLNTPEAYMGRVTFDAGPSWTRFSQNPATDLTPDKIIGAQQEAISGYPMRWVEMIEQVLSRDSHLSGIGQQRVDDVMKGSWRLVRSTNDDIAAMLRNACEEVLRGVEEFEDGLSWLLWSNAYSYNAVEISWQPQKVVFSSPNGKLVGPVDLVVPFRFDNVHPKHFRFNLRTDEPLLWLGTDQVSLPPGKFVFLKGEGQHPITERRGYAWQCVWLSMFKSIGWAGWATYVERFGLPTPLLLYEGGLEAYNEQVQTLQNILLNLGQGYGAIAPQDGLKIDSLDFKNGGRSGDPHSAISDACEAAQSVRVLGATLTAKIGNVGSFAASTSHLEVKYAKEEADARRLWNTIRSQLLKPFVEFNAAALATAIGNTLGTEVTPDMLVRRVPRGLHRVPRDVDPVQRMNMTDIAVNKLGLKVSAEALYDEMNFAQPLSAEDVLPGEAVSVSKGGGVVSSVEAAHRGATVEVDENDDTDLKVGQIDRSPEGGGSTAADAHKTDGDTETDPVENNDE